MTDYSNNIMTDFSNNISTDFEFDFAMCHHCYSCCR
jgi:hypothetical protein